MAIIKCPECGQQISDQAPVCPHCGVKIAGNIIRCPQCGTYYLKNLASCPKCGHPTQTATNSASANTQLPPKPPVNTQATKQPSPTPKKKGHGVLIVSFIIALVVVGVVYFFYASSRDSKEQEAYEYAMKSEDAQVLQSYLDTYRDAQENHRDSVESRLNSLKQTELDWTNAVMSNSKAALNAYLDKYPESIHKIEVIHKIDSIDWAEATSINTPEAIQKYLDSHSDGEHVDEASLALKDLNAKTVQPQEKTAIQSVLRHFFQSINSRNEDGLSSCVATFLTSFLGKSDATLSDVITFMNKIYKDDVANMNWRLGSDYKIDKKEVGEDAYQYNVAFSATQEVNHKDSSVTHYKYRINATVDSNGKISAMNMTRIIE